MSEPGAARTGTAGRRTALAVAALLAVHAALLAWSAAHHAPAWDEPAHVVAGLHYWRTGDFSLYRVNPPLPRLLAALPVLAAAPATDWRRLAPAGEEQPTFALGFAWVAANGARTLDLVALARLALIPVMLLGAACCFAWGRELHGPAGGLLALALWTFDPLVLGHGSLATTDGAGTALVAAWGWLAWRQARAPSWPRAAAAGAALGLALACKSTALALVPALALGSLATRRWRPAGDTGRREGRGAIGREAAQLAGALVLAVLVLDACYLFRGTLRPLGDYRFRSQSLSGRPHDPTDRDRRGNRFAGGPLAVLPVPLPADFVLGLDDQTAQYEQPLLSYLDGQLRAGGWRTFYVRGLLWKLPLGTLGLLALAVLLTLARPRTWSPGWRTEVWLLLPPTLVLLALAAKSGRTVHVRYAMLVLPFAFVAASRLGPALAAGPRAVRWATAGLAGLAIAASLAVSPHWLGFFNSAAGGERGGPRHLLDSNVDWGQDLTDLARWLEANPQARPLRLAYHGAVDPRLLGIDFTLPPPRPEPGWHAASVNVVFGMRTTIFDERGRMLVVDGEALRWLRDLEPVASAGPSIRIYHVSAAAAGKRGRSPY